MKLNTPKLTHRCICSQTQHSTNRQTEHTITEYGTWRYPTRTRGGRHAKHNTPSQEGLTAHPSMMTYVHAATEEYDTPSRITTTAQKLNYFIHRTGYNPTQATNNHTPQEITKKGNTGSSATCVHTHCY
jgi:hypothetical protein